MMKTILSRPQQLREQLLQAIDAQNNIHDMTAILGVICCLETFPMTKEALLETRLGKLINDVRKQSTDKDLVNRLKNLLRSWQRLVGVNDTTPKDLQDVTDKTKSSPEHIPGSAQTLTESYSRTLSHRNTTRRDEMRFKYVNGEQRVHLPSPNTPTHEALCAHIRRDGSAPKTFSHLSQGSASGRHINYPTKVRPSKIPVRAIKPYSSSLKYTKQFTIPPLYDQYFQDGHGVNIKGTHKPHRHNISVSQSATNHLLGQAPSTSISSDLPKDSSFQDTNRKFQQSLDLMKHHDNILKQMNISGRNEISTTVTEENIKTIEDKIGKNQHCSLTDKLDECFTEDSTKRRQLQESKLMYSPDAQQVKLKSYKMSNQHCDGQKLAGSEVQQRNWTELSQNVKIKTSTNLQNILLSSETQTSRINFSAVEKERDAPKECRARVFIPDFPVTDLPGVSRAVTEKDLHRIRSQQWHGVNGCYDNKNNWYDWTRSITLDSSEDGRKLQILPYVCIDYRF